MPSLRCTSCAMTVEVPSIAGARCPSCDRPLDAGSAAIPSQGSVVPDPASLILELTYQKTGEQIVIRALPATLGRDGQGADILSKVPQLSRRHCDIEFRDGTLFVRDSGSRNGTQVESGATRLDCRKEPRPLADGALLWLGQERFLARIRTASSSEATGVAASPEPQPAPLDANAASAAPEVTGPIPIPTGCPNCGQQNAAGALVCAHCSQFLG